MFAMKRILWLASWYPDRVDPLSGDFIERHARAVSALHEVTVLYIRKDHLRRMPGNIFIEERSYGPHGKAVILYYKPLRWRLLDRCLSGLRYLYFYRRLIGRYLAEQGRPHLVHVHVAYRAGLMALYLKWRHSLPFVVSEHWTVFVPGAKPGWQDLSLFSRWLLRKVYKHSAGCTAVSDWLCRLLQQRFTILGPVRIGNVVNDEIFYPEAGRRDLFTFLHVSTLGYQKNPEQMLEAVSIAKRLTAVPFQLIVYGPALDELKRLAEALGITGVVHFRNEVPQETLAAEMRRADALILYSRYETFGCVVIEAFASGVPVIVSDIPPMREIVDAHNGVLVAVDRPDLLAEKMVWMMQHRSDYDTQRLVDSAKAYSFTNIAMRFAEFYSSGV